MNYYALGGSIVGAYIAIFLLSHLISLTLKLFWKEPILARKGISTLLATFIAIPLYIAGDGSENAAAWAYASYPIAGMIVFLFYFLIEGTRKKESYDQKPLTKEPEGLNDPSTKRAEQWQRWERAEAEAQDLALEVDQYPFGSKENPIRVQQVAGQHHYLKNLHGTSGVPVEYERVGSVGVGPYGNILDKYLVKSDEISAEIYFDMYHMLYQEKDRAPIGFKLSHS